MENEFDSIPSLRVIQLTTIGFPSTISLTERFYGALTGLNKTATAEQLGEDLVQGWRGSLRSRPPALDEQNQVRKILLLLARKEGIRCRD